VTALDLSNQRVLVTGGAGFIGSHLVEALLARGAAVRVLDNLETGRIENLAAVRNRIELIEGDIRDREACRAACRGAAFVFHEAARGSVPRSLADPAGTIEVNVGGTANVLAAAREAGVARVVYASSSSVYGESRTLPRREGSEGAVMSPYALSKRMGEDLAATFAACYGMELIGLRYFNVYGPRQRTDGPYAAVIPRFFHAALSGEAATIYGDGEQRRDFTFVGDAVRGNLLAAAAPKSACGRVYNIGGGRPTSVTELARHVRSAAGSGAEPIHREPRAGDVRDSWADLALATEALGYSPMVGLVEGLGLSLPAYVRAEKETAVTGAAS
jgi:nucleoside-diphosphate-sugar epimerase